MIRDVGRFKKEMDHESPHDGGHEGRTYKERVPVLQGRARVEIKYEVVVYSCALPHENVASIQKDMQAEQRKHAAQSRR